MPKTLMHLENSMPSCKTLLLKLHSRVCLPFLPLKQFCFITERWAQCGYRHTLIYPSRWQVSLAGFSSAHPHSQTVIASLFCQILTQDSPDFTNPSSCCRILHTIRSFYCKKVKLRHMWPASPTLFTQKDKRNSNIYLYIYNISYKITEC